MVSALVSVLESQDFPALFLFLHPCNHCTNTGLFYLLLTSLPALLLPYKSSMEDVSIPCFQFCSIKAGSKSNRH